MKRKGFTLIELLVVMAIIVLLAIAATVALNPAAQLGKANDATRKKNLATIKVAFEEYINDTGCYPNQALISQMMTEANCSSNFWKWLTPWPCDPVSRKPYTILIDPNNLNCPRWYKVFTQLENKSDGDIPANWYKAYQIIHFGSSTTNLSTDEINYGVSSSNVTWNENTISSTCQSSGDCFIKSNAGGCQQDTSGCRGPNCYADSNCSSECQLTCCGGRCN